MTPRPGQLARLTQIDGTLPNLALMRLAHWLKAHGVEIHFTRMVRREVHEPHYDWVFGSSIFKFSEARIERFKKFFPEAILGGTGTHELIQVENVIGPYDECDYSMYPQFLHSIGFTQRGCRLKCKFCVVPAKEGKPFSASTVHDIWRGPGHPKKIHLLDNDFFGNPDWRDRLKEIQDGKFKVCLSQGINIRLVNEEAAEALATIEYRDNKFQKRRLYTAWDNLKDEKVFFRGVDTLERAGVPSKHLMAYMLVGYDPSETWERILYRFERMVERGIMPYPMVFDNTRKDLKKFQRWAVKGIYRLVPFKDYDASYKTSRLPRAQRLPELMELVG